MTCGIFSPFSITISFSRRSEIRQPWPTLSCTKLSIVGLTDSFWNPQYGQTLEFGSISPQVNG